MTPLGDPEIEAELTRIWPLAEALGWSYERIWNVHFWPNTAEHPRGLASILQPGDDLQLGDIIAEITADHILIERTEISFVKAGGVITRHERQYRLRFPKAQTTALGPPKEQFEMES